MKKRTVVIVSDLHVGSRYSVFPAGFHLSTGQEYELNSGQEYLLECWNHMLGSLPKRFDMLIINGEHTHGQNLKEEGRDLVEVDPEWQARAALELLQPLSQRAKVTMVTRGSGYHTGSGGRSDEACAHLLNAYKDPAGHYAWTWGLWDIDGVLLDVAHTQSSTIRYQAMPLEREQQFDRMSADIKGGSADIIIRAHTHTYKFINIDGELALSTPAWTLQDGYAKSSRFPNRWLSRLVGAARLDIYPERKTPNCRNKEEYVKCRALTYATPPIGYAPIPL